MCHTEPAVESEGSQQRIDILLIGHYPAGAGSDSADNIVPL
jgi:hypothetical protein